jgi:hypothetical protein
MVELLSASERHAIYSRLLREWLSPLGLAEIAPRRWIDGSKPPARRLFELQLLKGASVKACWGFSLDFVPHSSGSRIRWHRSDKTAMLDVIVDPRALPQPCFLYGSKRFQVELEALLLRAVPLAEQDWDRGTTFVGMLEIIQEIRDRNTNCFNFLNYTQLPLALIFLAAKVGEVQDANRELEEYLYSHSLDERAADRLRQLVSEYQHP